jgi:cytoskeletal protein CcmA (bactofilin family)
VYGESQQGDAVQGRSHSAQHAGVSGLNDSTDPRAIGVYGSCTSGTGTAGKFDGPLQVNGDASVNGALSSTQGLSVLGGASISSELTVQGYLSADTANIRGQMQCAGDLSVAGDVILTAGAGDCAEDFEVSLCADIEPGTVMALDSDGKIRPSEDDYDKKVVGVVSGAGEFRPGLILDRHYGAEKRVPLALIGKVCCKVDASYGAITVGDLLTTSATPGHAMRASDSSRAFGAIIGKALSTLNEGRGLVPILVALQ